MKTDKGNDKVKSVSIYSLQCKLSWKMYFIVNVANRYHAVIGGVYYEIVNINQFCQPL